MSLFACGGACGLLAALLVLLFYQRRTATMAGAGASGNAAAVPPVVTRAPVMSQPLMGGDEKYPQLVHKAKDAILTTDATGKVDFLNRSAQTLFGYTLEEALGKPLEMLLPRKIEAATGADGRAATVRAETVGKRKDGTEFPIELSLSKWTSSSGAVSSAIVRDATERHRADAYLKQSEANFRALIEQLPQGVLVHRDGLVVYVNTALRRLLKLNGARITGSPLKQLYIPARPYTPAPGVSTPAPRLPDAALRRPDGTRVPVEATSLTVVFDGKPATVLIVKDVSEERAMQAQMIFADRMSSIGTLAAGVAHEVNNPLSYVLANLEFLKNDMSARALRKPEEAHKLNEWTNIAAETREGVERVRRIARDLKVLSRADDVQSERMTLEAVVQTSLHLASTQLQARAKVTVDVPASIEVMANEPRLVQVFLNLLVNAAQAMPDRATEENRITIEARDERPGWVIIRIRDNGNGIAEDARARIFEPFFTTKEIGIGTGLGLPISLDIIRSLGGELLVESRAGEGSEFCIRLRTPNVATNLSSVAA